SSLYQPIVTVEPDLVSLLRAQSFTGNVRELEHAVVRMLFAKNHGTSLGLEDWFAQAGEEKAEDDRDFIAEAAQNVWQSISRSGLSYSQTLQKLERKVLTIALLSGGRTRR